MDSLQTEVSATTKKKKNKLKKITNSIDIKCKFIQ